MAEFRPLRADRQTVISAMRYSEEFFIRFFLDEVTNVPKFHIDIFSLMTSTAIKYVAIAIPRGHAKTTLAKLSVVYYFLFTEYRFILYLSATSDMAEHSCRDIIDFMRSDNFIAVFGDIEFEIERRGTGFFVFYLKDPLDPNKKLKKCILRAQGSGKQVRGMNVDNIRPQLAVCDDIEDNDNVETDLQANKSSNWFYGPFLKCLDAALGKVIHIGNMIAVNCLIKSHIDSPMWHSRLYGSILSDGSVLWPEKWSISKLKLDFDEYALQGKADIWFAEMMNMILNIGRGLIKAENLHYRPQVYPGQTEYATITVDLAFSNQTWSHKTALSVHGFVDNSWQHVDYTELLFNDPIELYKECIRLSEQWNVTVIGLESVGAQKALVDVCNYLAERDGHDVEFVSLLPGEASKTLRLASFCALIANQGYYLTIGDMRVTQQLLAYDPSKKTNEDDLIDSAAYITEMLDNYSSKIFEKKSYQHVTMLRPTSSYELCRT